MLTAVIFFTAVFHIIARLLRQHRIIIVVRLLSQIFRQIV